MDPETAVVFKASGRRNWKGKMLATVDLVGGLSLKTNDNMKYSTQNWVHIKKQLET